jgi:hypothetical protein
MDLCNKTVYIKSAPAKFLLVLIFLSAFVKSAFCQGHRHIINMVYSSDAHYGITRAKFKGDTNVPARVVNAAMIKQMNSIPLLTLPQDGGINEGQVIGPVDYVVQTGDIANRMEIPVQTATVSWAQFEYDYMGGVTLKGHNNKPATLLLAPGNHDISNAIGYTKLMQPLTDPTSMVKIYNLMLKPRVSLTNEAFDYQKHKINYSLDIKGIHLQFITLWADSAERIWMEKDLANVSAKTPVIIFCHDQPTAEATHFTNPVPPHTINVVNKFQNLLAETYKEGAAVATGDESTAIEQRGFVKFLKRHTNIKAYFHGNSNYNEFYDYNGPDNDIKLNTFRVDSPMKGKYSAKDESRLSFQLISLDAAKQLLTVRECLWDTKPGEANCLIVFGESRTISLTVN